MGWVIEAMAPNARYPSPMAIPDYQTCMLPFLQHLADGAEHTLRDAEERLAEHFKLSATERAELLPSGQQGVFRNRVGWARTYLKKAGLVESPKRAVFRITERGLSTLAAKPNRIDVRYLEQFPEFIALYHANMQRVGAKGRYFFSRAYFEKLRTQLGDRVHLVCAMTGTNDLAAAGLMIITDGIAQHHLLATAEQYQRRSPSKLVVDCMWRWAQEQVCHTFHIGGGVGGREDSLFHFKAGFSPMRSQFCSYRVVMDNVKNRALNLLVNLSADVRASADFFPGYRHFEKQSDSALIPPMIS